MPNNSSERRVKRAVDAIGKLNLGEMRETLAIVNARWLYDDELDSILPTDETPSAPEDKRPYLTKLLSDYQDAERIGQAIADLLELRQNNYPGDQIRFDTIFGDKTYEGLARTIARCFEDASFRTDCNETWESRNPNGRRVQEEDA